VAFVSGFNRITVYQTQFVGAGTDWGLTEAPGNAWVVSLLDITNFGTAPQTVSLANFQWIPTEGGDPVASDVSQGPSAVLEFGDVAVDGSATIPVDSTIRIAVAFSIPVDSVTDLDPTLVFGDQRMNVGSTVIDAIDSTIIPPPQPWAGSQGVVQSVLGNETIEVNTAGAVQTVSLAGVATPPADGCFGAESSAAVLSLSGGAVWVEDDPTSDGSLVWYWDGGRGHLALLNQALVEQGFGAYDDGAGTAYAAWLSDKSNSAETSATGLWNTCKGVGGEWINPPTQAPAPTKTADEVRAEYTWIDTRDLVIRPNSFNGEKVAVQGNVLSIYVDDEDFTVLQIWLDGGSEVAVIGYEGDSTGIYEGTWITVYGEGAGTTDIQNAYGGLITQPLIYADIVDW